MASRGSIAAPAASGETVASLAHDLANVLASISAHVSVLANQVQSPEVSDELQAVLEETRRARDMIRDILHASRPDAREAFSLVEWVKKSIAECRLEDAGVAVRIESDDPEPWIFANREQLGQLLTSVFRAEGEALRRLDAKREIRARVRRSGETVRMTVASDAPAVPPDELARVLGPFVLRNPPRWGGGIGFGVCKQIARAHGGAFSLDNASAGGREYSLELPAAEPPAAAPRPAAKGRPALNGKHFLIVDDDRKVRESFRFMLQHLGCTSDGVESGADALRLIEQRAFDGLILDLHLGDGLGSAEVLEGVPRERREILRRTILSTGDPYGESVRDLTRRFGVRVLAKPFGVQELRAAIDALYGYG